VLSEQIRARTSSAVVVVNSNPFAYRGPLVGVGTINDAVTLPTLLVTLLGSVVLLAIYKAVARR